MNYIKWKKLLNFDVTAVAVNDKSGILSFATYCSFMVNVWWETWQRFYRKFLAESKHERFLKSANICQSYEQIILSVFFWLTVYMQTMFLIEWGN